MNEPQARLRRKLYTKLGECATQEGYEWYLAQGVNPFERISKILVTRLENNQRKDADSAIFNHEGGSSTLFPGIVVETGLSDALQKSRRDIRLWLDFSENAV
jgi:hypothetical protein